ncbi:ankyrin repeat domain-containing protein [Paraburkholderia sp. C35]|uniref:ankyrin repeat domain-containing protein n=1 Tax=Paraburkholderia sp. C35 TaxID=2126993 RepID=UPI000D685850|nr:ankyrin repeat domain-containing protein [Paraburkholderia sp. C35]
MREPFFDREIFDTLFYNHPERRDPADFRADLLAVTQQHGADAVKNARNWDHEGLLHVAVGMEDPDSTRALLEAGHDPNRCGHRGSVVDVAALLNHEENLKLLLEHGADARPRGLDEHGRTPLHHAAAQGSETNIGTLLDYGAPVDALDKDGNTALAIAVRDGQLPSAQLLIKRNADLELTRQGPAWQHAEDRLATPMPVTEHRGEFEATERVRNCVNLVHKTIVEREQQALRAAIDTEQAQAPAHTPAPVARVRHRL